MMRFLRKFLRFFSFGKTPRVIKLPENVNGINDNQSSYYPQRYY